MKFCAILVAIVMSFSCALLSMPDDADAARMGGGRSFGSRSFMNQPAQRPAVRQQNQNNAQGQATGQQAAPGRFGGMGGILGGLLAGTLIGSLLAGHGFSGGGFFDLILLAILAFIAYKLFMKFRQQRSPAPEMSQAGGGFSMQRNMSEPFSGQFGGHTSQPPRQASVIEVPSGFDVDEFMRGAKLAYTRLQKSWDERDLADISQFVTEPVMRVLEEQLAEDPNPGKTEIMQINAELTGVEQDGDEQRAQVYFDVLMREDPKATAPVSVREIWHFARKGEHGTWKLDGIQQVR